MRKSLIPLAAVAALVHALPALPAAAQPQAEPQAQAPAEAIEAAVADRKAGETLAGAQARLAFALIEKVAVGTGHATVSPASLAWAFGILNLGADPAMKAALAKALGFAPDRAEAGLAALAEMRRKHERAIACCDQPIKLDPNDADAGSNRGNSGDAFVSASRIVFAPTNPPNGLVRAGLDALGIGYSIADLSSPGEAAKIDAWVKGVTKGAIPEILGGPMAKPSFVVLNALHFKSRWRTPFDPQLTAPAPFTGIDGKSADVAMMRLGRASRAFRQERHGERSFVAIDLPFADERFSLVVVTATGKPAAANEFAPVASWLSGAGFTARSGDLALPRFSVSGREDLMPALDALGLDEVRRAATALQGFAPGAMLSQVVQHAIIEVDEEGAEAAAATAVMASRMLQADDGIHMVVDKPFVYALRDKTTGLILVAGYVGQPPKGKTA